MRSAPPSSATNTNSVKRLIIFSIPLDSAAPRMSLVLQSLLPYPHSCQGTSPHQQGWDTKMAMLSFCGIDVSMDRLDVVVLPEGWFFSVSNDTAGWAELVVRLRPLAVSAIGLEP